MTQQFKAKSADIALILEGSYPFVAGGVSQWVHQVINSFPEFTFAVIFLGSDPEHYKAGMHYILPKNVVHFQIDYLFGGSRNYRPRQVPGNEKAFLKIQEIHEGFRCLDKHIMKKIGDLDLYLNKKEGVDYEQFLFSKESWDFITENYTRYCTEPSFIDYYWTIKNIHQPLWIIAEIAKKIPKVKVVHTISTGYAGFLATLLAYNYQYPVILTEHGIYTKERRIEILQSKIFRSTNKFNVPLAEVGYLKNLWNRYFETLARLCYQAADPIISLFSLAHQLQLEGGANSQKSHIIPNGIDVQRFKSMQRPLTEKPETICFIGRVVPIKDVKGLIRSMAIVQKQKPNLQLWIIGSTDEDPKYARECHELVENLSLKDHITFKEHQAVDHIFPQAKILVLSSISESMPLVILESLGAGVPVISTDVGASRELILGATPEDQEIGPSGKVVKIAEPEALGNAILALLADPALWQQYSQAGIKRIKQYYDEKLMVTRYREIYLSRMR